MKFLEEEKRKKANGDWKRGGRIKDERVEEK